MPRFPYIDQIVTKGVIDNVIAAIICAAVIYAIGWIWKRLKRIPSNVSAEFENRDLYWLSNLHPSYSLSVRTFGQQVVLRQAMLEVILGLAALSIAVLLGGLAGGCAAGAAISCFIKAYIIASPPKGKRVARKNLLDEINRLRAKHGLELWTEADVQGRTG